MDQNDIIVAIRADEKSLVGGIKVSENALKYFEKTVSDQFKKIKNSWINLGAQTAVYTTALKNVAGIVNSSIISPISGAVNSFVEFGDKFAKTSQRVGMSAETLGGIKFAAEQCGAGFDDAIDAVKTFQEQLGAAKLGDAGAIGKLGDVGIHAADFDGLDSEEQILKLADHIAAIGDRAEQTRTAIELFGDAGFKLLPFFQEGSNGIKKLMAEGKNIGAVLGNDAAASAAALGDAMNRMKTSCANVSNLLMSQLAPAITAIFDAIAQVVSSLTSFASANADIIQMLSVTMTTLGGVYAAWVGVPAVVNGVVVAMGALKAAIFAINPLFAGLAVAFVGVAGAMVYWERCTEKARAAQYAIRTEQAENLKLLSEQQSADQKRIGRLKELQELSEKDTLNNSEVEEANRLTEELAQNYGDLGIQIDAASGKIIGMTAAQKKLNEELNKARAAALENWIAEAKSNNEKQAKQAEDYEYRWSGAWDSDWSLVSYATGGKERDLEKAASLRQGVADRGLEIAEKEIELKRLRGEKVPEKPEEEKTTAELTKQNQAARAQKAEAEKELEKIELDTDLMDPLTKAYHNIAKEEEEKYRENDKKIATAKAAGNEAALARFESERAQIPVWAENERKKIQAAEEQKQEEAAQQEYEAWKKENPELIALGAKDTRLANAESVRDAALESHANAVLAGNADAIAEAEEELKKSELALARIVATVSGEELQKAKRDADNLRKEYEKEKKAGAKKVDLNKIAEEIFKADELVEAKRREQSAAIGQLQSEMPREAEIQEAAESVRVSSRGTFSAYGLDSAVGADIPKQSHDQLRKICQAVLGIYEQKGNEGFVL